MHRLKFLPGVILLCLSPVVGGQSLAEAEVRLPYAELKQLLVRAEPAAKPASHKTALLSAHLRLSIENERPVLDATFRAICFGDDTALIPLLKGDFSLGGQDPQDAAVVIEGEALCLAVESAGIKNIRLRLLPIVRAYGFALALPACPAVTFEAGELGADRSVLLASDGHEETLAAGEIRPLDSVWQLQAPGGEGTRTRFILASSPLLGYAADGLSVPLTPQGLPTTLAKHLGGNTCRFLEAATSADLSVTPMPVAATAEGVVSSAEWLLKIEPDGAMLATGVLSIDHKSPLEFTFDTPAGMKLLSCELGGKSIPPVDLGQGQLKVTLPAGEGQSSLVCLFTGSGEAMKSDYTFTNPTRIPQTFYLSFPLPEDADGFTLAWDYPDVLAAPAIGMDMPKRLNAGPVAARIAFFAPVSLLFFVTVILLVGGIRGIALHPMHVFFVSTGCFGSDHPRAADVPHRENRLENFLCEKIPRRSSSARDVMFLFAGGGHPAAKHPAHDWYDPPMERLTPVCHDGGWPWQARRQPLPITLTITLTSH